MKITGFDISNFKGIRNAKIRFSENDISRVHTFVGLNESGKTTLLEAMHSFSRDIETELVVNAAKNANQQREQWVPRHKISYFSGEVSITAHIEATSEDWFQIVRDYENSAALKMNIDCSCKNFTIELSHKYSNGNFQDASRLFDIPDFKVKSKRARNFRTPSVEEHLQLFDLINQRLPTIAYYPTFIFDFPKRIYLTDRDNSPRNRFYRRLFQDILDYDSRGFTIKESILDRLHKNETNDIWSNWYRIFAGTSEEDKVKQVIAHAEQAVTHLVFSKWREVFGENVGNKEIAIDINYEPGKPITNEDGTEKEAICHDAYIRFRIKDGTNYYSVDDRSLGFRWFFSFLLFTQFRIHRERQNAIIFLFDEPASNLHATAQKKLLESFPTIAQAPHRLIYSTHSHYMVNPMWLEQAYIVFDQASEPSDEIITAGVREDAKVDIQVVPYRRFIQERPNQTSYFQPILDTLEVQPSVFDYSIGGLIVEGKSDYYILKLCSSVTGIDIGPIFPAQGSGTMGALVSLHRGWGLPVRVLFDSDTGGKDGKKKLNREFGLSEEEQIGLNELMEGLRTIEDLFQEEEFYDLKSNKRNKSALFRRIQECLASNNLPKLSKETKNRMELLLQKLKEFIED